jgi:gluconate 2-dehydrogenase gamma chain
MTQNSKALLDRRQALRRAALLLGGALSASAAAAVIAGCEARGVRDDAWHPRALTSDQADLVATIAEHILPETDTPGARAVGVHRFIDAMLAESYPPEQRRRFLAGLGDLDAHARQISGHAFLQCRPEEQRALLDQLDRETYAAVSGVARDTVFRTLKELTLLGYYTSEVGATRELHHAPVPGRFQGCVPLAEIGRTWAV